MAIKTPTSDISDLKLGNTNIQKVYKGVDLVWERQLGYTPFELIDSSENSGAAACNLGFIGTTTTHYHNGTGDYPVINDIVYVSNLGLALVGGNSWYAVYDNSEIVVSIKINLDGLVTDTFTCIFL